LGFSGIQTRAHFPLDALLDLRRVNCSRDRRRSRSLEPCTVKACARIAAARITADAKPIAGPERQMVSLPARLEKLCPTRRKSCAEPLPLRAPASAVRVNFKAL